MTFEEEVKVIVKAKYDELGLEESELCNDDKGAWLAEVCEDYMYGSLNLNSQTQEQWDVLEKAINELIPPNN